MTDEEIYDQLTEVMRKLFKNSDVIAIPELTARDVKGWDSLKHIRFVLEVEKAFRIKFKTSEIASFQNVGDLVAMIKAKQA